MCDRKRGRVLDMTSKGNSPATIRWFDILTSDGPAVMQPQRRPLTALLAVAMLAVILVQPASFGQQSPNHSAPVRSSHLQVQKSNVIVGFEWIEDQFEYPAPGPGEDASLLGPIAPWYGKVGYQIHGDTFPMTWADDGEIYASAGDPSWGGKDDGLDIEKYSGSPPHYTITRVNPMADYKGSGGKGTNGVLYLAFQNLLGEKPPAYGTKSQHGSDATIVSSRDHGKTWTPAIGDIKTPMFPGNTFGGPAFVNSGRDNANAPDGYVYAVSTDQWDNGSKLRVGRVPADRIQDVSAWEWISELKDYAHPQWSRDLQKAIPVLTDERRISLPDMVYIASIKRYLLLTWRLYKDFSPDDGTELMIYDAPHPWGPFTLVHHEAVWESRDMNPYCPRLPLKWLTVRGGELVGWIQFSGSWRPNSLNYRSHVRQFRMKVNKQ